MKNIKTIILLLAFTLMTPASGVAAQENINLIDVYPSDETAFTQGLEVYNDRLMIGTGLYGDSLLGYLDLETGDIETIDVLADNLFGEGITVMPNNIIQLTWRENTALVRDLDTFDVVDQFAYEGEGWGIAYDDDRSLLWMSNGSSTLYQRDPYTFEVIEEFSVTRDGSPLNMINELEYANGMIYANVWYSHEIVVINPETGQVEEAFDFLPMHLDYFSAEELEQLDTFNGIAHIEDNLFYVTGKLYPVVFEVEMINE